MCPPTVMNLIIQTILIKNYIISKFHVKIISGVKSFKCIYQSNIGRKGWGWHCAHRTSPSASLCSPGAHSLVLCLLQKNTQNSGLSLTLLLLYIYRFVNLKNKIEFYEKYSLIIDQVEQMQKDREIIVQICDILEEINGQNYLKPFIFGILVKLIIINIVKIQ